MQSTNTDIQDFTADIKKENEEYILMDYNESKVKSFSPNKSYSM